MLVFSFAPATPSEATRLRLAVLGEYSHRASELTLTPLADEAADALARTFLPGLDAATTATLVSRAAGNPFYLEELLRAVVEGSVVDRRRTWTLTVGSAELMPPALESLLLARIDRLPDGARRLVQVAAVVGRTFPVRVLETAADTDDLDGDLTMLLRAEVVREVRRYPELECAFRHELLQQAALSTLTAGRRRELYGRVAAAFEELYAASLDDHLERLAHYYAQAEDRPKTIEYLERAAARHETLGHRSKRLGCGSVEPVSDLNSCSGQFKPTVVTQTRPEPVVMPVAARGPTAIVFVTARVCGVDPHDRPAFRRATQTAPSPRRDPGRSCQPTFCRSPSSTQARPARRRRRCHLRGPDAALAVGNPNRHRIGGGQRRRFERCRSARSWSRRCGRHRSAPTPRPLRRRLPARRCRGHPRSTTTRPEDGSTRSTSPRSAVESQTAP